MNVYHKMKGDDSATAASLLKTLSDVSVYLDCRARWGRGVLMVHLARQDQRFVVVVAIIVWVWRCRKPINFLNSLNQSWQGFPGDMGPPGENGLEGPKVSKQNHHRACGAHELAHCLQIQIKTRRGARWRAGICDYLLSPTLRVTVLAY